MFNEYHFNTFWQSFFLPLIFVGLSFEWHKNHDILFSNNKNKKPGLKTSSYSNLETGLNPVLFVSLTYYFYNKIWLDKLMTYLSLFLANQGKNCQIQPWFRVRKVISLFQSNLSWLTCFCSNVCIFGCSNVCYVWLWPNANFIAGIKPLSKVLFKLAFLCVK